MPPSRRASSGSQFLALLAVLIGVGVVALAAIVCVIVVGHWHSPYTPSGTFLVIALVLAGSALVTMGICGDRPLVAGDDPAGRGFDVLPTVPDAAAEDE